MDNFCCLFIYLFPPHTDQLNKAVRIWLGEIFKKMDASKKGAFFCLFLKTQPSKKFQYILSNRVVSRSSQVIDRANNLWALYFLSILAVLKNVLLIKQGIGKFTLEMLNHL